MLNDWLAMKEASAYIGVGRTFLFEHRYDGKGPPFHRRGYRVLYSRKELDAWIDHQRNLRE